MKKEQVLQYIIDYGLSVRQIPKEVFSSYSSHGRDLALKGNIEEYIGEVEIKLGKSITGRTVKDEADFNAVKEKLKLSDDLYFKDGAVYRKFYQFRRIPSDAGKWMAKQITDTSLVTWSKKEDNLSDTLEEAVIKAVNKINQLNQ